MRYFAAIAAVLCCVLCCHFAQAQAPYPAYSTVLTINGAAVPLTLVHYPTGQPKRGFNGRGDGPQLFDNQGRALRRVQANCSLYEKHPPESYVGSVVVLICTCQNMYGQQEAVRYECAPPLTGTLSMNLVGAGVWAAYPGSLTLTPTTFP